MPRIPYPEASKLSPIAQQRIAELPLNIVKITAHASVPLFEAQGQLGRAVQSPEGLEPRLREAVILRVAELSNSAYELFHHIPLGRAAGLTEVELGALTVANYSALNPLLAAAARFTDEVVTRLSPSDETLANLRKLVSDQVILNIVLTIGCYMTISRVVAVTGIEPEAAPVGKLPTE
jgi:4-carboxymuconolactone decarboxylase